MSIYQDFLTKKEEQLISAEQYEKIGSLEMAYMALWSVTEHTAKDIESYRLKLELKKAVKDWSDFLHSGGKRPQAIRNFTCEEKSIPSTDNLTKILGDIPAISKLLQTKKKGISSKYRDKRNAIAHHAEKFGDTTIFKDYKQTALDSIKEFNSKLKILEQKV